MTKLPSHPSAVRNQLLAALPSGVLTQLLTKMHPVTLDVREVLYEAEAPIQAVHFMEAGWTSLIAQLEDGMTAEVGMVGREGMVGLPLVFGVGNSYVQAMVQSPGTALRMEASAFHQALDEYPPLRALLFRYGEFMHAQVTQTAACNGNHGLEQRLARWLLMSHDRADGDELPMTQEFLATMLCVHRPSVTVAARILQRANIIRYGSGTITVVDRPGLDLLGELRIAGNAGLHLPAQDRRLGRPAAGEGHIGPLPRVAPHRLDQHPQQDVVDPPRRSAAHRDGTRRGAQRAWTRWSRCATRSGRRSASAESRSIFRDTWAVSRTARASLCVTNRTSQEEEFAKYVNTLA